MSVGDIHMPRSPWKIYYNFWALRKNQLFLVSWSFLKQNLAYECWEYFKNSQQNFKIKSGLIHDTLYPSILINLKTKSGVWVSTIFLQKYIKIVAFHRDFPALRKIKLFVVLRFLILYIPLNVGIFILGIFVKISIAYKCCQYSYTWKLLKSILPKTTFKRGCWVFRKKLNVHECLSDDPRKNIFNGGLKVWRSSRKILLINPW